MQTLSVPEMRAAICKHLPNSEERRDSLGGGKLTLGTFAKAPDFAIRHIYTAMEKRNKQRSIETAPVVAGAQPSTNDEAERMKLRLQLL